MSKIPEGLQFDKDIIFGTRPTHPGLFEIKFHNPTKYNSLNMDC